MIYKKQKNKKKKKNEFILEATAGAEEEEEDILKMKKKLSDYEFQRRVTNRAFEQRRKTVAIQNLQKEINQIIDNKQNILSFNTSLVINQKKKKKFFLYYNIILNHIIKFHTK